MPEKMTSKLDLSHIKTCNQVWDEMPICGQHRTCQACQEPVVDFREMTDFEIATVHSSSERDICGIYNETQLNPWLNTSIPRETKEIKNRSKIVLASLLGLLATQPSMEAQSPHIQIENPSEIQENGSIQSILVPEKSTDYHKTIKGRLMTEAGEDLPGASIFILGTDQGTISDQYGQFSLNVSKILEHQDSIDLVCILVGYGKSMYTVQKSDFDAQEAVIVASYKIKMTSRTVVGVRGTIAYRKPSFWQRVRQFFKF